MVYIKRVQLSHFKSFGGTADVPLLTGFTVVTGPNGSGKSNILDGLMFALGLSSSKGMRADRLPDLVNQSHATRSRQTVEASVTATFCLADWTAEGELSTELEEPRDEGQRRIEVCPGLEEWSVTRRLRVTPQGTYTSSYFINEEPCTLTQLHEQLRRLRIYPEGYNIVLQGDVTGIISMHPRERREIIDEMAGVAQFDRKIRQAMGKLDEVKEREDRCHIVERELEEQLQRLAKDRIKAEKYKRLREELETQQKWEAVLIWEAGQQQAARLQGEIEGGDRQQADLTQRITALGETITASTVTLEDLNQRVKALGEAELIALQSTLATHQAEQRQLERQLAEFKVADQKLLEQFAVAQQEQQEHQSILSQSRQTQLPHQRNLIAQLQVARDKAHLALESSRSAANAIAPNPKPGCSNSNSYASASMPLPSRSIRRKPSRFSSTSALNS
ncbi:MAG: AAA family ATPase [Synechococcales cyanobacterium RU_4_20]|nr:AAA family ATPase [Synechococcales cyanobacterium RU_4_20]